MRLMLCTILLLAPLALLPATFASEPATGVTPTLHPMTVSTGVTPPKEIGQPPAVYVPLDAPPFGAPGLEVFHLKLDFDSEGQAHGIQVVASENPHVERFRGDGGTAHPLASGTAPSPQHLGSRESDRTAARLTIQEGAQMTPLIRARLLGFPPIH